MNATCNRVRSLTHRGAFPLFLLLLTAQPAVAQRLAQLSPTVSLSTQPRSGSSQALKAGLLNASSPPPTHWLEGGLVGAAAGGTLATFWGSAGCEGRCTVGGTMVGFALGAGLGFTVGALIGGQFPKHRTPPP